MLLSRLLKNFPRILMAITRNPLSASISSTVSTVSYKIEFPTFLVESVFVATWKQYQAIFPKKSFNNDFTCARISFIVSLACASPFPSNRSKRRILIWRKGSVIPDTSCSGLYPVVTSVLRWRTRRGTAYSCIRYTWTSRATALTFLNSLRQLGSNWTISAMSVVAASRLPWFRSVRRFFAFAMKWSIRSGTFFTTRSAQSAAYKST